MRVLWMFFLFGPTALGTTDFFKYEYAGDGTSSLGLAAVTNDDSQSFFF